MSAMGVTWNIHVLLSAFLPLSFHPLLINNLERSTHDAQRRNIEKLNVVQGHHSSDGGKDSDDTDIKNRQRTS